MGGPSLFEILQDLYETRRNAGYYAHLVGYIVLLDAHSTLLAKDTGNVKGSAMKAS
jgi:hypothetical protein